MTLSRREFVATAGGTAIVGGTATAAATSANRANAQDSVTIDMTDELVFDPDEITVSPGTTVVWENVGTVPHSVTAYEDEIPDDAEFFASGGFDSENAARNGYPEEGAVDGGETYEHTFEVEGTYGYFCIPHEQVGMVAELTVSADAGDGEEGGGGESGSGVPGIPESARVIGIVTTAALVFVVALAYFFLKYGGDYEVE